MKHFAWIALVFLMISGHLFAQEGDDAPLDGVIFRPVEDILDQELVIGNFLADGTASLSLETKIPVACTLVYGKTLEFGKLTLDQDMAGGTHSVHNPLLTGLEPETTYYFRVQGIDDQGVIYLSEVMTFITPAFEAVSSDNLASPQNGAEIIGYSSAFGGAGLDDRWGAGSAFDGNPSTQWSSAGDGDAAWVEVKLEKRARIKGVAFWSRDMSDGSAITQAFTVTTDDGEVYGPYDVPDTGQAYTFEVEIEAQTLRFDLMDTTGGNTGAVDIAVYGEFIE